jgi:hypothetical protein
MKRGKAMGIKDFFKRKPPKKLEPKEEAIELPEMDRDAVLAETLSTFAEEDVSEPIIEITHVRPEYDTGIVEVEDLLVDEMDSNYELNTVEVADVEEVGNELESVEIIGDLPEEVEF